MLIKEFYLNRSKLIIDLGIITVLIMTVYLISLKTDSTIGMIIFVIFMVPMHVFYIPLFLFYSLHAETKQHQIWLYNPNSPLLLFLPKFTIALLGMLESLLITGVFSLYVIQVAKKEFELPKELLGDLIVPTSMIVGGSLVFTSIYLGIVAMFFWSLFQVIKKYFKKLTWVAIIACFGFVSWILYEFEKTGFFSKLTNWGKVKSPLLDSYSVSVSNSQLFIDSGQLVFGYILYEIILAVIMIFLSKWMIDRKVEV
ncbi:hypothetical protein [Fredinandcohnia quinoae]|uniref:Uncharacterized protein n=1 Tax=Fredinandcohnia quinoae TaxID=2918902 RepID=A0AAW5EFR2_9BACI|nr:hypothetical protein [Fredinandcohnia sp. SECRCQ15]MCH1627669.1 hypothetical protein [Fredinandcohnia sp. SECRCQ15]